MQKIRPRAQPLRNGARVCVVLLALAVVQPGFAQGNDLDNAFARTTIVIEATKDACYRFDVYLAERREQQIRGLMNVRELPVFTGMLFVYTEPEVRSMWMKNTYISLDMLFIREDGSIANIVADTEPLSLETIFSVEPVTFVLELNAGVTARLHIDTNSRVYF